MRPASRLELLIPLAMAASLLLPGPGALIAFLGLAAVWIRSPRRGGGWMVSSLIAGSIVVLLILDLWTASTASRADRFGSQVAERYQEIWQSLDDTAASTIDRLDQQSLPDADPLAVFRILGEESMADFPAPATVLLIDSQGDVFAWGGNGLLHELKSGVLLPVGRHHRASFSAVTLLSVRPIDVAGSAWNVVAGLSLRTESFPFADPMDPSPRWTLIAAGGQVGGGGVRVSADAAPDLVVEELRFESPRPSIQRIEGWRRWALMGWGIALLVQAWSWILTASPQAGLPGFAGALFLLALAAQSSVWAAWLLTIAGVVGYWSGLTSGIGRSQAKAIVMGVLASLISSAMAVSVFMGTSRLPDLGSRLISSPADLALVVALALLTWGLFNSIQDGSSSEKGQSLTLLWVSFAALLASGAALEWAPLSLFFLVFSGATLALWKRARPARDLLTLLVLGVMAPLIAATGWEGSYRQYQKIEVREHLLPALAPPTATEVELLADEMSAFLGTWDLAELAPAGIGELSRQDLAFKVWSQSPLARNGGLSALRVLPDDGGLSSFSFGLPLNDESWVDWSSPRLATIPVPAWQDAVLVGDSRLRREGKPWGYAEYALALEPGFRLGGEHDGDLAEVLLRADPKLGATALMDLGGAVYGLFGPEGQPIASPWSQPPELSAEILGGGESQLVTPDGPSIAFGAVGADGIRVVFFPRLSPLEALERVGSHALPSLLILAGLMLLLQIPRWAREGVRSTWFFFWHSYSRRLVLVYSVLVLVPLGIINFLVVRAFEERLVREQAAAGLLAVESAQGVLGEFVLALKPGFGIDAALDDERLHWLSGVVHHDVNLYWRGSVYASSKRELFTAGLLPRRIPGEIYSDLTLRGHALSLRTNQAGRSEYLELYAPLTVPGVSFDQTRLIVSLPMLAQQQETSEQINSLRRRSLLGTAAMVLLIMALGARLARRFTSPLTEIIEGTQRIAAGEASLKLRPAELELATLVEAIDDMASRIHAGRQELLREKRVVDRMVESITAGVVSLDVNRRVLMVNKVAGDMVGLEVGQDLDEVIGRNERLAPLVAFVSGVSSTGLTQQTVSLRDPNGKEQEWTLVWVPLPGEGEPSSLLVLEDVTEVLRGQRLQAWAEMARMIAHEIKNPLTPIRLSAEHMQEVYASDPENFSQVFENCTANILNQVGELQEIASDFSTYSRIPKIDPRPGNLVEVVADVVSAYGPANFSSVQVTLVSHLPEVVVTLDAKLVARAVRNLLENAVRAAPNGGQVKVAVDQRDGNAEVVVSDNGPGVKEGLLSKIFDPYFSTHDSGTGLGLPIAKRIAEEHGGQIIARNRESGGLSVTISLPIG